MSLPPCGRLWRPMGYLHMDRHQAFARHVCPQAQSLLDLPTHQAQGMRSEPAYGARRRNSEARRPGRGPGAGCRRAAGRVRLPWTLTTRKASARPSPTVNQGRLFTYLAQSFSAAHVVRPDQPPNAAGGTLGHVIWRVRRDGLCLRRPPGAGAGAGTARTGAGAAGAGTGGKRQSAPSPREQPQPAIEAPAPAS